MTQPFCSIGKYSHYPDTYETMRNADTSTINLTLSDHIYDIRSMHFDAGSNEIFAIGVYDQIALATLAGELLAIQELPKGANIISQQRTPAGWQFLYLIDTELTACLLKNKAITAITLDTSCEKPRTAAWSPCGKYVAIGTEGTTLTVCDTQTGKQVMRKTIQWNKAEREFINPPTLSVISWSNSGNEIICLAKEMLSSNMIAWDFKKKVLISIIG